MLKTSFQSSTGSSIRYVLSTAWIHSKLSVIYYSIVTLLTALQPFILLLFPKLILDELMGKQRPLRFILLIALMFVLSSTIGFLTAYLQNIGQTQLMKVVFSQLHAHTAQNLNADFKNTEDPVFLNQMEQAKRSLQSVENGFQGLFHTLFSLLGGIIALSGYFTVISRLGMWIILFLIGSVAGSYFFSLRAKKYEYEQEQRQSVLDREKRYYWDVMQDFAYGKEIRIYSLNKHFVSLFQAVTDKRRTLQYNISKRYFQSDVLDVIIRFAREGSVYSYLAYLYVHHRITVGDFAMYTGAVAGFSSVLRGTIKDIAHLRTQNLYIQELRSFLEPTKREEKGDRLPIPSGPYTIEFKNVSFGYPNSGRLVFENLSFIIPAHQRLAIVGHNGAGKTTLIKLLCRLYEPDSGEITLNGINIQRFSQSAYWDLWSTVFQEIRVLAFTVAENVSLQENGEFNAGKVHNCLEMAGLGPKISTLKYGINTHLQKFLDDEGVEWSGGENQRMMLARALYKNGDLIVLDEPTAAVDPLAEFSLYKSFDEMIGDRTALYISHRLSSTRFCDQILLMEWGEIAERGTHKELLERNGKYAQMFQVQAQYYKGSEDKEYEPIP
ncbi:ABC transporter ATP-binding protein [Paenibacillus sp. 22594]|uniref:ABC transporter ATP-binding protein n=1 Tax=Paenibacillus sp. 22594 TaxID=3453947 RepID=UPI003F858FB0